MIKLIIFDLDGVLIDSKLMHFNTLNSALRLFDEKYAISYSEHLEIYDGLNTLKKLELLSVNKGLPKKYYDEVFHMKQSLTFQYIKDNYTFSPKLVGIFSKLREEYLIAVASNSIRETVKLFLLKLGILEYVDYYISNEDVKYPKPYPEMYWKVMNTFNVLPKETLILEDSPIGRTGVLNSGCNLLEIDKLDDVKYERIMSKIKNLDDDKISWKDDKLNVLIPMAGLGSRFATAGYTFPKPLIEVFGKPMIQLVVENLNIDANYIFIVQKEHFEKYNLQYLLQLIKPNCKIIQVDGVTEGAACTALLAKEFINNDNPLLIANSDQYIEWNSNKTMYSFSNDDIDGGMLVFETSHPKYSFAKLDSDGFITEVAEKKPISNIGSVGIYYYRKGSEFVKYVEQMIESNIRVNNEFYICPVYNEYVKDNKKLKVKYVDRMWGIGDPDSLDYFIESKREKV